MKCKNCKKHFNHEIPYCELCVLDLCLECIEIANCKENNKDKEHVAGEVRYSRNDR